MDEHTRWHLEKHGQLDEILAHWITETGMVPRQTTVWELMAWSAAACNSPAPSMKRIYDEIPCLVLVTWLLGVDDYSGVGLFEEPKLGEALSFDMDLEHPVGEYLHRALESLLPDLELRVKVVKAVIALIQDKSEGVEVDSQLMEIFLR